MRNIKRFTVFNLLTLPLVFFYVGAQAQTVGQISNLNPIGTGAQCLQSNGSVTNFFSSCDTIEPNQYFTYTDQKEIQNSAGQCLQVVASLMPVFGDCNSSATVKWIYDPTTQMLGYIGGCLLADPNKPGSFSISACGPGALAKDFAKWTFIANTPPAYSTGKAFQLYNVDKKLCLKLQENVVNNEFDFETCDGTKQTQNFIFTSDNYIKDAFGSFLTYNSSFSRPVSYLMTKWSYDTTTQEIKVTEPLVEPATGNSLAGCLNTVVTSSLTTPCDGSDRQKWQILTPADSQPAVNPGIVKFNPSTGKQCLEVNSDNSASVTNCIEGKVQQKIAYVNEAYIVNNDGKCLATSPTLTVEFTNCQYVSNQWWSRGVGGNLFLNLATQTCLDGISPKVALTKCYASYRGEPLSPDRFWVTLLGLPQRIATTTNNLVAKNDSYAVTSNTSRYQGIDQPAAKGVRVNDLPSGWPDGLTFELVSPITRTGGTGTATAELYFRDSGGFYVLLKSDANSNANRRADKRGTYTFTYKMVMDGQSSAPATVTINVN